MPLPSLNPEIVAACRILFGRPGAFSASFISSLEPDSLKSAFRKMALQTHPDRALALGRDPYQMEAEFRKVVAAFDVLSAHLEKGMLWTPGSRGSGRAKAPPASSPCASPPPRHSPPRGKRPEPPRKKAAPSSPGPGQRKGGASGGRQEKASPGKEPPKEQRQGAFDFGASPSSTPRATRFWQGPLPERYLKLGQFLFFSGIIPARELIDAIWWQRRQRPAFGQIAREWGILTSEEVLHVLQRRITGETFGECAARLGYMTGFEQLAVASRQKNLQRPLGQFFLENRILLAEQLEEEIRRQKRHNIPFAKVHTPP